jgi:cell division protein ZapA
MAQVTLTIGSRRYDLACRDGEEAHLRALGAMVDQRAADAARAVGDANEARQLLMAALLLADELNDLRSGAPDPAAAHAAHRLDTLAQRIESLARHLENEGHPS